jgi:hypothetical protein
VTVIFLAEHPVELTTDKLLVSIRSDTSSGENTPRQGSQCSGDDGRTPAEIRHRGILPFNSTHKDEFDLETATEHISALLSCVGLLTEDNLESSSVVVVFCDELL